MTNPVKYETFLQYCRDYENLVAQIKAAKDQEPKEETEGEE